MNDEKKPIVDYERAATEALVAASIAINAEERNAYLDQASTYAYRAELKMRSAV